MPPPATPATAAAPVSTEKPDDERDFPACGYQGDQLSGPAAAAADATAPPLTAADTTAAPTAFSHGFFSNADKLYYERFAKEALKLDADSFQEIST